MLILEHLFNLTVKTTLPNTTSFSHHSSIFTNKSIYLILFCCSQHPTVPVFRCSAAGFTCTNSHLLPIGWKRHLFCAPSLQRPAWFCPAKLNADRAPLPSRLQGRHWSSTWAQNPPGICHTRQPGQQQSQSCSQTNSASCTNGTDYQTQDQLLLNTPQMHCTPSKPHLIQ